LVDEVLGAEVAEEVLDDKPVDLADARQVEGEGTRHLHDVELLAQVVEVQEEAAQRVVYRDRGRAHALRLVDVLRLERVRLLLEIVQQSHAASRFPGFTGILTYHPRKPKRGSLQPS